MLDRLIRPEIARPAASARDPRIGAWLGTSKGLSKATRIALLGFPSDEGVRRNGGRVGAAEGPTAIRAALYALTPSAVASEEFVRLLDTSVDLGDVPISGDLECDQAALGEIVALLLNRGVTPIILGGGHETAFGHALGYLESGRQVHVLNWDAHADVRPLRDGLGHSGSPFRQTLEHPSGLAREYVVAGLHPWRVSTEHRTYVEARGRAIWVGDITASSVSSLTTSFTQPTLASFDLDAVDGLPGVSAPGDGGMPVQTWLAAARACGRNPAMLSFDIVELNPRFDVGGRSARIAALTVWHILAGRAEVVTAQARTGRTA